MGHYDVVDLPPPPEVPARADVVVVGAGVAGLYTAWRLLEDDPSRTVCVFEASGRTGGRLHSDLVDFGDRGTVKEEQGGMRFTFEAMDSLMSVLLELGLDDQVVEFPMSSGGRNRRSFRGRSFSAAEAAASDIWSSLYALGPDERRADPASIVHDAFARIVDANPEQPAVPEVRGPEFWQRFRLDYAWHGTRLADWSLWSLLDDMGHGNECIQLLSHLLGFNGTFLSEMSAGEAFQLLEDFPANPGFKTLRHGFSTVPNALAARVGGDRIWLGREVVRVDPAADSSGFVVESVAAGESSTVEVGEVVLALPRFALQRLLDASPGLGERWPVRSRAVESCLPATTQQSLLKLNLYYESAWWAHDAPHVRFGPSFADLPLGAVYPFYALDDAAFAVAEYAERQVGSDSARSVVAVEALPEVADDMAARIAGIMHDLFSRPAALTIYCDDVNVGFWSALQGVGEAFDSPLQRDNRSGSDGIVAASAASVRAASRFLCRLFDLPSVPEPVMTSVRIWSDPTVPGNSGYGVHQWARGADDRAVIRELTQPFPHLFVCGEAYSDYQGWVEGALRSADLVLREGMGITPLADAFADEHGAPAGEVIAVRHREHADALIARYLDT